MKTPKNWNEGFVTKNPESQYIEIVLPDTEDRTGSYRPSITIKLDDEGIVIDVIDGEFELIASEAVLYKDLYQPLKGE